MSEKKNRMEQKRKEDRRYEKALEARRGLGYVRERFVSYRRLWYGKWTELIGHGTLRSHEIFGVMLVTQSRKYRTRWRAIR